MKTELEPLLENLGLNTDKIISGISKWIEEDPDPTLKRRSTIFDYFIRSPRIEIEEKIEFFLIFDKALDFNTDYAAEDLIYSIDFVNLIDIFCDETGLDYRSINRIKWAIDQDTFRESIPDKCPEWYDRIKEEVYDDAIQEAKYNGGAFWNYKGENYRIDEDILDCLFDLMPEEVAFESACVAALL